MPASEHPVARFKLAFAEFDPGRPLPVADLYTADVQFEDPFHNLRGLADLSRYFARLNAAIKSGRFEFEEELVGESSAMLAWTMYIVPRRTGRETSVRGVSLLHFTDKISYQRDYFDAGALVYEQIPILGRLVRLVKSRLARGSD